MIWKEKIAYLVVLAIMLVGAVMFAVGNNYGILILIGAFVLSIFAIDYDESIDD